MVDVQARAVRDRLELVERDVEPVARPQAAGGDQHVAAAQLAALDARECERDPLARLCPLDRAIVHVHAPDAHVARGRLGPEHVALGDCPRPERPGRDRPDPAQREDAIDVEARRLRVRGLVFLKHKLRRAAERVAKLVEPGAGLRADRDRLGLGNQLARLVERKGEHLLVDGVGLRHRDDAVLDPEQADDREVLERLGTRALAGVDDEQEEVDPRRARDHVADEPLVPRNVDQREPTSVGQVERGVAEVDRDPAPLLLGQPVGVLPGQGPHEPRLAVVDVPRGADGQRHASTAAATSSASASVSVRQSSSVRPSRTTAITGGSCERSAQASSSSTAQAKLGELGQRQRAASHARDCLDDSAAGRLGEALGAAEDEIGRLAQHAHHGDLVRPVEVERERPLERSERQLVRAERAVERVPTQLLDQVGPAGDDSGLGAAQQLVPREADEVGARGEGGSRRRLALDVDERAGAEVVEER